MGELRFTPEALKDVPQPDRDKILEKITWLWDSRSLIVHHPLRHGLSGLYKRVFGKYRIIYRYDQNPDDMTVHMVGTRDSIYKDAIK
ncbi:MAG: hypothetical protein Q8N56_00585, partial [bacterium]|nr:hypothetical protein [bacterium]